MQRSVLGSLAVAVALAACGDGKSPSPFDSSGGAAGNGGSAGSAGASGGGPPLADPSLGGPCLDDQQCDDGLACSDDVCDRSLGRCRFTAVNERCADGEYCNGVEVCRLGAGCRPGDPVQCSDRISCTIDRCIEETRSCEHTARDADGDGDAVWNCGGGDCDDTDPAINDARPEICANTRDDDCNGQVDEVGCTAPAHDTCADAREIAQEGTYALSLLAASEDVALSCVTPGTTRRDVVVALTVPPGPALDVDVTAVARDAGLALGVATSCSRQAAELACSASVPLPDASDGSVARVVLRELAPGAYPLYVSGLADSEVDLRVAYRASEPAPTHETCGTALPLSNGERVLAPLTNTRRDLSSACLRAAGELVYRFELDAPQDVVLRALALDPNGTPSLSLRGEDCVPLLSELDCRAGSPARLFARALPAGTYFVAVGASGPSDVELGLELRAPSEPPAGQGCLEPPALVAGVSQDLELGDHVNAVASACLSGAIDATWSLTVTERSDVLLVERLSAGDTGALSLLRADCSEANALVCQTSEASPVRARAFAVLPGEYRVVAESLRGNPLELSAFVRRATPPTLVAFADSCEDAVKVPETGGRFSGNTNTAHADFEAGCDYGGGPGGGAGEQMLRLALSEPRRVILDMSGSDYATILVVRRANGCPGTEVLHACAPGRGAGRSFLDLVLPAGDYFLQIDGYNGASGHWLLDVFVSPP